jgi:hypothetical protein
VATFSVSGNYGIITYTWNQVSGANFYLLVDVSNNKIVASTPQPDTGTTASITLNGLGTGRYQHRVVAALSDLITSPESANVTGTGTGINTAITLNITDGTINFIDALNTSGVYYIKPYLVGSGGGSSTDGWDWVDPATLHAITGRTGTSGTGFDYWQGLSWYDLADLQPLIGSTVSKVEVYVSSLPQLGVTARQTIPWKLHTYADMSVTFDSTTGHQYLTGTAFAGVGMFPGTEAWISLPFVSAGYNNTIVGAFAPAMGANIISVATTGGNNMGSYAIGNRVRCVHITDTTRWVEGTITGLTGTGGWVLGLNIDAWSGSGQPSGQYRMYILQVAGAADFLNPLLHGDAKGLMWNNVLSAGIGTNHLDAHIGLTDTLPLFTLRVTVP